MFFLMLKRSTLYPRQPFVFPLFYRSEILINLNLLEIPKELFSIFRWTLQHGVYFHQIKTNSLSSRIKLPQYVMSLSISNTSIYKGACTMCIIWIDGVHVKTHMDRFSIKMLYSLLHHPTNTQFDDLVHSRINIFLYEKYLMRFSFKIYRSSGSTSRIAI